MSLWLAVIWLICAALCIAVFGFCRKRIADVGQQVSEEVGNSVNKILKAERDAEARLLEAFTSFNNPAEAIRIYQKIMTEIFPCPQANPGWNWTREDLELWRKDTESQQRANRSRSTVLAVVVIILALNIAAAVTTVIALNTIKPAMSSTTGSLGIGGTAAGQLPQPVSIPPQSLPVTNLPSTYPPPIPTDDDPDKTKPPAPDVDNSILPEDPLNKKPPTPNADDKISSGINRVDRSKLFLKPGTDSTTSNSVNKTGNLPKDIDQNRKTVDDNDTIDPFDSQSKGEDHE